MLSSLRGAAEPLEEPFAFLESLQAKVAGELLLQPLGIKVPDELVDQPVGGEDHEPPIVHIDEGKHHIVVAFGAGASLPRGLHLISEGESRLVAMMAVGDEQCLIPHRGHDLF